MPKIVKHISVMCIGVDPSALGSKGGIVASYIAVASSNVTVLQRFFCDFSEPEKILIFLKELKRFCNFHEVATICGVENIWGRPKMSVRTVSKMMQGQGFILGALQAIFGFENVSEILPETWQKKIKLGTDLKNNLAYSKNKSQLLSHTKSLFSKEVYKTILPNGFAATFPKVANQKMPTLI
jgi:hypothetical protein